MNNDQENIQFWSSLLHSLPDSDPKYDHFPEISSPIMVMSTSMAIDVSHQHQPQKAIAGTGGKSIDEVGHRSAEKQIEVIKKEGEKEVKNIGKSKRPRTNEARNIAEKRRRTDIKTKIENLKQLTPNCKKRDIASTLDCIIDNIRWMKHYVEVSECHIFIRRMRHKRQVKKLAMTKLQNVTIQSQSMGPMLPLGMKMDFPAPWFPSIPPSFIRPPFNCFIPQDTSCACGNQKVEPAITKGFNNQPPSSRSM